MSWIIAPQRSVRGSPTLGICEPISVGKLVIGPSAADLALVELDIMQRRGLFECDPREVLEKMPFGLSLLWWAEALNDC